MDSKEKAKRYALWTKYGLTLEERNEMEKKQKGKCWICQQVPKNNRLNTDHRHVKGYKAFKPEDKKKEVRGLLCFMCNTMLTGVEKRLQARFLLGRMVEYFKVFRIKGDE
jgi:hypothetical protein